MQGVLSASPTAVVARQKTLTDRDFPTDAKRRKLADLEAKKKGQASLKQQGKRTNEGGYEPAKDPVGEKIEKYVTEKAEEFVKPAIPTYEEDLSKDAPRYAWEKELENATAKLNEYIKYMADSVEWAKKWGQPVPIGPAIPGMEKVFDALDDKLGKAKKWVKKVDEAREFVASFGHMVDATRDWDPADRESGKAWAKSIKRFLKSSNPYVTWLRDHAVDLGLAGSQAGAVAAVTLPFVFVQIQAGAALLEAGINNIDAYFDRLDRIMREIDLDASSRPIPDPPPPPAPFLTLGEKEAQWQRELEYRRYRKQQSERERAVEAVKERYDTKEFPVTWLGARAAVIKRVLAEMRKGVPHADEWWEAFLPAEDSEPVVVEEDAPVYDPDRPRSAAGGKYFDPQAGFDIFPRLMKLSPDPDERRAQLEVEIDMLENVSPPCPYFKKLYDDGLARAKRAAGL